ncbi:MAG: (4Fe-4S)-binding protein [Candidatus Altiarchaeales archaeon ex4484_96]|nr:MAG: (4Fe-4S)-binding protein [Candidatus Altiarchaeales archaeon ex4484_96]
MKQITVLSGKGGTGKTSLVSAFASLAKNKVLADCDVDAADLHLILKPEIIEENDFRALKTASIDGEKCTRCGECVKYCVFDAISDYLVNPLACEGCAVCELVCPVDAVSMNEKNAGKTFISNTRCGPLVHAILYAGEEASGKLVALVRKKAKDVAQDKGLDLIIIDGSPGIGCPVIASLSGADLALIVTEPTISGLHDLERIVGVTEFFKIKSMVCINKYNINREKTIEIKKYCLRNNIPVAGEIPYSGDFTKAMVQAKSIVEYGGDVSQIVKGVWDEVNNSIR